MPPQDVAAAVFGSFLTWTGNELDMWAGHVPEIEKICGHDDPAVRAVGEYGYSHAAARREQALDRERHGAVYGER